MRKLIIISTFLLAFACSENETSELNSGGSVDSGEPCDPATDFFCVDTPDSGMTSAVDAGQNNDKGDAGDGKGDNKGDDNGDAGDIKGGGKLVYRHQGKVDTSNGQGTYELIATSGQEIDCMIVFDFASASEDTTCPSTQCDFAWALELGTQTTSISGSSCGAFKESTGSILQVGHRAPNQLAIGKAGSWSDFGTSEVSGDNWDFSFEYSF